MATISKTTPNATLSSKTSDGISPGSAGGVLGIDGGGTGLSTLGLPNQLLRVNATQTALEYFTSGASILSITGSANINVTGGANPVISLTSQVPIANGGTALSTVGTNGQVLTSNGTSLVYQTPTTYVSSVAATVPSFLSISGSPITSSGTLAIGLSGTALPTTSGGTGLTTVGTSGQVLTSNGTSLVYTTPGSFGGVFTSSNIAIPAISASQTSSAQVTTGIIQILQPTLLGNTDSKLLIIGEDTVDHGYIAYRQVASLPTNKDYLTIGTNVQVPKIEVGPSIKIIDTTDPTTTSEGVLNILNPNALSTDKVRLLIGKNTTSDYGKIYWEGLGGNKIIISSDPTNQTMIDVAINSIDIRGLLHRVNITGSEVTMVTDSLPLGNPNLYRDVNGIITITPPVSSVVTPIVLLTAGLQNISYTTQTLRYVNTGRTLEVWFHLEGTYTPTAPTNVKIQATIPGGWVATLSTVVDFTSDSAVITPPIANWGFNISGQVDTGANTIDFFVYYNTVDGAAPTPVYSKPLVINPATTTFRYKGHASILIS